MGEVGAARGGAMTWCHCCGESEVEATRPPPVKTWETALLVAVFVVLPALLVAV